MPTNFLTVFYYVLATALGIAFLVTAIAFSATVFAVVFAYVFIPLLIIAFIRWLWLKYQYNKQKRIFYYDDK